MCIHMCKYVDKKNSVAILGAKRLAGFAPEVNLRNPLYTGNKACKRGIHSGFHTQGRSHQKSKPGISVTP